VAAGSRCDNSVQKKPRKTPYLSNLPFAADLGERRPDAGRQVRRGDLELQTPHPRTDIDERQAGGRGVDNMEQGTEEGEALRTAKDAAAKFGCVFAVTGPIDNISNGKQAVVLNNGHPLMQDITGSGCMTTTLVACCAAITKDMLVAAALGVVIMGQSAELAANFLEKKDGPGMFKVRLIDAIYHVTTKWNLVNLKPEEKVS